MKKILILKSKKSYHLIIIKSTIIPTTTRNIIIPILEKFSGKKCGTDFGVSINPEFLREGNALKDFMNPDRIVIGQFDEKSGSITQELYKSFNSKIIRTSLEAAEMIKYVNNSFLGLLISYSNELANICELINVDIHSVLKGLYYDSRLSPKINGAKIFPEILSYISPGPGFGGSCLPKDILALIKFAEDEGYQPKLLKSIFEINENRPEHMIKYLKKELKDLNKKTITVLGISFKPNTSDIRDSPSIKIIKLLLKMGANIKIYDPVAVDNARNILKNGVIYSTSLKDALKNSDGCILVTKWDEFKNINPELMKKLMKNPFLIDCRRFLNVESFKNKVKYIGTGLGKI